MPKTTLRKTLRSRGNRTLIKLLVTSRSDAGMTQRDLAALLKRPHSFVGRIEAGERRVDVIEFIEIARVLNVDPRHLFSKLIDESR
jgi:transcriptional regulator with XRE-family HTH domain